MSIYFYPGFLSIRTSKVKILAPNISRVEGQVLDAANAINKLDGNIVGSLPSGILDDNKFCDGSQHLIVCHAADGHDGPLHALVLFDL